MAVDDDIAAALPRPPPAAPGPREAAIAAAMRCFDGEEPEPTGKPRARPAPAWGRFNRPYAGALAGALLVALFALPLAWTSLPDQARDVGDDRRAEPPAEATSPGPVLGDASPSPPAARAPEPLVSAERDSEPPPIAADAVVTAEAAEPAQAAPRPAPAAEPGERARSAREEDFAEAASAESRDVVVTGSRVARPNLSSVTPVTAIGDEGARKAARAADRPRGDWNACTIDDPSRDVGACRRLPDPAAKGASGRAAAQVADGLERAWEGDHEQAIAAFDRAIAIAPRSSIAYLNRGLAWRRMGDLDRALADLDRAVRYGPRTARNHYYRSLVLRQRGETRRARADEERAVELDRSYADLIAAER